MTASPCQCCGRVFQPEDDPQRAVELIIHQTLRRGARTWYAEHWLRAAVPSRDRSRTPDALKALVQSGHLVTEQRGATTWFGLRLNHDPDAFIARDR